MCKYSGISNEFHLFRLAGRGGEALFVRSLVAPQHDGNPKLVFDVSLLSSSYFVSYFARGFEPGFVDGISRFFMKAASDADESAIEFSDESMGLAMSVLSSTIESVSLLVNLWRDPSGPESGSETIELRPSRAGLVAAAMDARRLTGEVELHARDWEFPSEWGLL